MKTKFRFVLAILAAGWLGAARAQTFSLLSDFSGANGSTPSGTMLAAGSTLYGTTQDGGKYGSGTVFSIPVNGTSPTILYSFKGSGDGRFPISSLAMAGTNLYGTTSLGGTYGAGVVFAIGVAGTNTSNIYTFTGGSDGANPQSGPIISGGALYGVTYGGGSNGYGGVYGVSTNGGLFTNIHSFTGGAGGANPQCRLALAGNTLYGTTESGGTGNHGTVFQVNTDGSGFNVLYKFTGAADGAFPAAGLTLANGLLFGTANGGGTAGFGGNGTVFSISTNGTNFQPYGFNYTIGANPVSDLFLLGTTLYGTTTNGGGPGWGTVFEIGTDGSNFTNIYQFTDGLDGAVPLAGLTYANGMLFGTTSIAGNGTYDGSIYSLSLPALAVTFTSALSGGQVVLTWNNAAYLLQSASTVNGAYSTISGATSPYPIPPTNSQQYFRLVYY